MKRQTPSKVPITYRHKLEALLEPLDKVGISENWATKRNGFFFHKPGYPITQRRQSEVGIRCTISERNH